MKIAILSDIHDNVWALAAVIKAVQQAKSMICCGDLCSPFIVDQLAHGFPDRPIHVVFGNNDGDLYRIAGNAAKYDHVHLHGAFFEGELGGKRIAVNHYPDIALAIAAAGQHDVVCYGHNHTFQVQQAGNTLVINPGAVMGYNPGTGETVASTFVLYETTTGEAKGFQVKPEKSGTPAEIAPYSSQSS